MESVPGTGKKRTIRMTAMTMVAVPILLVLWSKPVQQEKADMFLAAYRGVTEGIFSLRTRSTLQDYVNTHEVRKLQIGAGSNNLEGWLNTDIFAGEGLAYLDATERFPFEDNSFQYVFSEHVIEHLQYEDGTKMLAEAYRILAPGGRIRTATPNLLRFVGLFQEDTPEKLAYLKGKLAWHDWPTYPTPECVVLNLQLRSFGHQFVYDPPTLEAALRNAGFESIQEFKHGESDDPELRGIEYRENMNVKELSEYETMILEAVKPNHS